MDLRPTSTSTIDICCLPIPPTLRDRLKKSGFGTVGDFYGITPLALSDECGISREEAVQVLKALKEFSSVQHDESATGPGKSAWELLERERQRVSIITFCDAIDRMLGGGVAAGSVTEFCGVPGIGKTQLGMQLAVDVQLPPMFGGAGGQAVYIDTEGSFMTERVAEIANAFVTHLKKMTRMRKNPEEMAVADALTVDKVLDNIYYYRVYNYVEQLALLHILPDFLRQHPQVKLVVIDSVTFHFRHMDDFKDMSHRTRLLNTVAQTLSSLADTFQIAVVVVNQVTTKVSAQESHLVPALGESWAHACTSRLILFWESGQRYAHLYKSPFMKTNTVPYRICAAGVRDIEKKKRERDGQQPPTVPAPPIRAQQQQ